ncbi:MAG: hypothetical protein ACRD4B_03965, partial [Acidobacteriota bacterium]
MSRLNDAIVSFIKKNPLVGGILLFIVGLLIMKSSMDSAARYRTFEDAQVVSGEILSITDSSSLPPRSTVAVSWSNESGNTASVLRVGAKIADELNEGDTVSILVSNNGKTVILESQRPKDKPVTVAGIDATPLFFVGGAM